MPPKWRSSSFFIPAQNSRHRTACLALYRALLNACPKVPLPDDLATAWPGKRHPIAHVIRRAFQKNRADTSTRLVYPALEAGYHMLDTLSRATDETTPEFASVLTFMRKRLAQRDHVLLQKVLHPPNSKNPAKPSSAPNPNTVPLLVNTTPAPTPQDPKPKPTYAAAARPRPSADLPPGKKRKIPVLDMAREYPFLRLGKPQSNILNRVLTQKNRTRVRRMDMVRDWNDEYSSGTGLYDCEEEDDWEEIIVDQLDREALAPVVNARNKSQRQEALVALGGREVFLRTLEEVELWVKETTGDRTKSALSYRQTLNIHGVSTVMEMLTQDRNDAVARAYAMRQIIKEEKALAKQEEEQDKLERRKRWEKRMRLEYGKNWEHVMAEEKRLRDEKRAAFLRLPKEMRDAEISERRRERKQKIETGLAGAARVKDLARVAP
ncbi:hypothetical protein BKA67DRAFT_396445 [Truncatella angustata]|uniref:Uncharacterized protein n=1 Tax=Truncatella angustata TaxID=152316 RepID=A0A9P8RKG2_9PEZI|nr:uncharacterized protein BKA67DRAFT_396445 [Truncatella angustata]KAH6647711.1 hypothetical protein BKA67DRAFT_396445 [Truncatella angustata]